MQLPDRRVRSVWVEEAGRRPLPHVARAVGGENPQCDAIVCGERIRVGEGSRPSGPKELLIFS
jgi:hypothetical protein